MYKAFKIVVKKGQGEEVLATTDYPFTWFPELERVFSNFNVKEMKFDIDLEKEKRYYEEDVIRVTFLIRKL